MGKIEKLKNEALSLECLVDCAKGNVSDFEGRLAEKRKQIAALEAAESKPREWVMFVMPDGELSNNYKFADWPARSEFKAITVIEKKPLVITKFKAITVIEKKPLVITKAASEIFYKAYNAQLLFRPQKVRLADGLKAIGIDAIAADEL